MTCWALDAKLTRFLALKFGDGCKMSVIFNLKPDKHDTAETVKSILLANKVRG